MLAVKQVILGLQSHAFAILRGLGRGNFANLSTDSRHVAPLSMLSMLSAAQQAKRRSAALSMLSS
jgi:hypothetical protein